MFKYTKCMKLSESVCAYCCKKKSPHTLLLKTQIRTTTIDTISIRYIYAIHCCTLVSFKTKGCCFFSIAGYKAILGT